MWTYKEEDPEWLEMAAEFAAMPREVFVDHIDGWSDSDYKEAMRMRFRYDREWFLTFFWPEIFNLPFNDFHQWALSRPKRYWRHRAAMNAGGAELWAIAAPRGNGKSALITRGECCHDTVYGIEGYTVILASDLKAGAQPLVMDIVEMMCTNELLHEFYGNVKWRRYEEKKSLQVGSNPEVAFFARSFQVQTRGTNFKFQRPTKMVVDDGEHPKRVLNPDNRSRDIKYLNEDLLQAGPPEGGLKMDWVGTVLHRDSILANIIKKRSWKTPQTPGNVWKAIWNWPKNTDLWDQCHEIWADLTNPDGEADAWQFYQDNREAMHEGARVMDPVTWPLYRLMRTIWSEGLTTFLKERQNEIALAAYAFFETNKIRHFKVEVDNLGREYILIDSPKFGQVRSYVDEMTKVGYLDPVPGQDLGTLEDNGAGAGDFAAFAVLAKDKHGYVYVLDVWMARARDSEQIAKVWELCERWKVGQVGVESNNFARMITRDFRRSQNERMKEGKYASVRFIPDHVQQNKEERIAALQPPLTEQGWLRINIELEGGDVEDQFLDFPNGAHDDGPDAIASAYRLLGGSAERGAGRTGRAL